MAEDTKKTAEEKIGEFLRFGSRLGLDRMNTLLSKLGDPQNDFETVHVAGTNGKGSCARYIYETLVEAGYRTGIYTSPFLERFNERIEFCREPIPEKDLDECTDVVLEKVREMTDEGCESPTEFEVVTAVCFLYFSRMKCDVAVLEVGLGGRGDSTNVVKSPLCSVITSISFDHMDRLGNTIAEIAGEKAGIIKKGCPVVVSTGRKDALDVFIRKAEEMEAPLIDARASSVVSVKEERPDGSVFDFRMNDGSFSMEDVMISMGGSHQITNAAESLAAVSVLREKLSISDNAVRKGFLKARQPGRFEIVYKPEKKHRPWVILDGAHNADGAAKLAGAVNRFFPDSRILTVCGMLKDKDVAGILDELMKLTDDFVVTEPDNERKEPSRDLAVMLHGKGKLVYEMPQPKDAVAVAMSLGRAYDVILFSGSLYLIGRVRTMLREHYLKPDNICFDRD